MLCHFDSETTCLFLGSSHKKIFQMKKKIFIAAAVIISSHAQGQKTSTLVSDSVSSLAELVVTATRFPTKQSSTGKM